MDKVHLGHCSYNLVFVGKMNFLRNQCSLFWKRKWTFQNGYQARGMSAMHDTGEAYRRKMGFPCSKSDISQTAKSAVAPARCDSAKLYI